MLIWKNGTRPSRMAPADWFTGTVWMDPIVEAPDPARHRALRVQFSPGARTNWHTHPLGQTIYVSEGQGYACRRGQEPQRIKAGDTVFFEPGEEHWHGAAPDTGMTHIAIQEAQDGSVADWLEPVSEADYPA